VHRLGFLRRGRSGRALLLLEFLDENSQCEQVFRFIHRAIDPSRAQSIEHRQGMSVFLFRTNDALGILANQIQVALTDAIDGIILHSFALSPAFLRAGCNAKSVPNASFESLSHPPGSYDTAPDVEMT
jgi:hypothetical protein